MNESVELPEEPLLTRNSLILTGLTLRTFSAVDSDCFLLFDEFVHEALPTKSPLKGFDPEVTVKVALALAPGSIRLANVFEFSLESKTTDFHPSGTEMLNLTSFAGAPEVFVNVTVVFCGDISENV